MIVSTDGVIQFDTQITNNTNNEIDLSSLKNGIYIVHISNSDGEIVKRLTIQL